MSHPEDAGALAGGPGHDLPLDAHVHTDLSPDSDVPIDVYAAIAVERGLGELAITDHVDFDRRDPAYDFASFELRERTIRDAAERWAPRGVVITFGAELTYNRSWDGDLRDHLRRHRYDFTIGSVHDWPDSPYVPSRVRTWATGRSVADALAPYLAEVTAAARSGLFDTIGHLDVVRRYLHPVISAEQIEESVDLFEPTLRGLIESGTALELNTSGFRHVARRPYPSRPIVERYRELGGRAVTAGSDAHRSWQLAWGLGEGYELLAEAGFGALVARRGGPDRRSVPIVPANHRSAARPVAPNT